MSSLCVISLNSCDKLFENNTYINLITIRFGLTLINRICSVLSLLIRVIRISVNQTASLCFLNHLYKYPVTFNVLNSLHFYEYKWRLVIEIAETFCWSKQQMMLRIVCNVMVVIKSTFTKLCFVRFLYLVRFLTFFVNNILKNAILLKLENCSTSMVKVLTISLSWIHHQVLANKVLHC